MGRVGHWLYIDGDTPVLARDWRTVMHFPQCGSCGCWWPSKGIWECHSHDFWRLNDCQIEDIEKCRRDCPGYMRRQMPGECLVKTASGDIQRRQMRTRRIAVGKETAIEAAVHAKDADLRRRLQALRDPGSVYLAHAPCRGKAMKIGKAVDPDKRLSQFRTVLPDVEFVRTWQVPNAGLLERTLHRSFSARNVGGEWFEVTAEEVSETVRALLQEVR